MPRGMSDDVSDVIVQALARGLSRGQISGVVGVSKRAITRINTNLKKHGQAKAPPSGVKLGRPARMTTAQAQAMLGWMVDRDYSFYVKDLVKFLKENHGYQGCDGTVRRGLIKAGFRRKLPWHKSEVSIWLPPEIPTAITPDEQTHGDTSLLPEDGIDPSLEQSTFDASTLDQSTLEQHQTLQQHVQHSNSDTNIQPDFSLSPLQQQGPNIFDTAALQAPAPPSQPIQQAAPLSFSQDHPQSQATFTPTPSRPSGKRRPPKSKTKPQSPSHDLEFEVEQLRSAAALQQQQLQEQQEKILTLQRQLVAQQQQQLPRELLGLHAGGAGGEYHSPYAIEVDAGQIPDEV